MEAWILFHEAFPWFLPLCIIIFGGVFGSFFNCAFHRMPRKESLRFPPSQCPQCRQTLGVVDLVPVLSWCWLRGRCRQCGTAISVRYVLVELATIAVGLGVWWSTHILWLVPLGWGLLFAVLLKQAKLLHDKRNQK